MLVTLFVAGLSIMWQAEEPFLQNKNLSPNDYSFFTADKGPWYQVISNNLTNIMKLNTTRISLPFQYYSVADYETNNNNSFITFSDPYRSTLLTFVNSNNSLNLLEYSKKLESMGFNKSANRPVILA